MNEETVVDRARTAMRYETLVMGLGDDEHSFAIGLIHLKRHISRWRNPF